MVLIGNLVVLLFYATFIAMFLRFIFSWIDPSGRMMITGVLASLVDPLVRPVRKFVPQAGIFDLSYWVVILVMYILLQIFQIVWFSAV